MKDILERLKSPVVIAQLVSIIGTLFVTLMPAYSDIIKAIVYSLTCIINVFSGLNNPADKENF